MKVLFAAFLLGGLFFLIPLVVPLFDKSHINCKYFELNLQTGKTRMIKYFWYMKIEETHQDTFLSHSLRGRTVGPGVPSPWRTIQDFPIYGITRERHHSFDRAPWDIEDLRFLLTVVYEPEPRLEEMAAAALLAKWQASDGRTGYHAFCEEFFKDKRERKE